MLEFRSAEALTGDEAAGRIMRRASSPVDTVKGTEVQPAAGKR